MDAWMAFASIVAIIAIVLLAGGLIAFIGHLVIGAFDRDDKPEETKLNDVSVDTTETQEPAVVDEAKAQEEQELVANDKEGDGFDLEADEDADLEAIENRLKEENADENVDDLVDEISENAIEEANDEEPAKEESELDNYSIDDILNGLDEESEETTEQAAEEVAETEESDEGEDEGEQKEVDLEEEKEEVVEETEEVEESEDKSEIESLKAQLAELNKELEEARKAKVEVVTINMTEDECLARLETLDERLKNAKKEYKVNLKEYKPLKKVMTDLERYQTKLRRKEAIFANKKVALYGVKNYVDIDKEKAEKLANELELLDGLRLSVNHCEEVINANKDRYPILEHTNNILEEQIANIEADIESTTATLNAIREQNGEGEN